MTKPTKQQRRKKKLDRRRREEEVEQERRQQVSARTKLVSARESYVMVNGSNPKTLNPDRVRQNRRFHRYESDTEHHYSDRLGGALERSVHKGFVKCKLVHGDMRGGLSLIVVDQIFLGEDALEWIQPFGFFPNFIHKIEEDVRCQLFVDISGEQTLEVRIAIEDFVCHLPDGSQFYRAEIFGPDDLHTYTTGASRLVAGRPQVMLFHHTTDGARDAIKSGESFRTSAWNIQGTKVLENVRYLYLTSLDKIRFEGDLRQIAMAGDAEILVRRDLGSMPDYLPADWRLRYYGDYLILPVYRARTLDRKATLPVWVDASSLNSQHVLAHFDGDRWTYQVMNPFIQRVGVVLGQEIPYLNDELRPHAGTLKRSEYVIVGDATTLEGLAAPFDEEESKSIFKIEMSMANTILEFWFKHANTDLYSARTVELRKVVAK